jgi:D-alanyl-D-alanine-carboxypeptidase/D-alanyl-D-alanine-endopeptidase
MKRIGTVVLLLLGATALAQEPAAPTDDAIRQMLAKRIDVQKQARAAVVGRSDARGRQIVAYGKDRKPLDGDSVFEIASLTKVLTALVLSDMVGRGEVGLMDSVTQYLPERVLNPDVRAINLVDLATHSSGFPRRLPGVELTDTPYDYGAVSRSRRSNPRRRAAPVTSIRTSAMQSSAKRWRIAPRCRSSACSKLAS